MMNLRVGVENKKHVTMTIILLVVIVLLAAWELRSSRPSGKSASFALSPQGHTADRSEKTTKGQELAGSEFHLRIGQLGHSEAVEYEGNGKDLFSSVVGDIPVEAPLAPARPIPPPVAPVVASVPAAPRQIDVKYLGYAESGAQNTSALFMHGDDFLVAKTGDIIFHRYKVGAIQPSDVQITDLRDNHTQKIATPSN